MLEIANRSASAGPWYCAGSGSTPKKALKVYCATSASAWQFRQCRRPKSTSWSSAPSGAARCRHALDRACHGQGKGPFAAHRPTHLVRSRAAAAVHQDLQALDRSRLHRQLSASFSNSLRLPEPQAGSAPRRRLPLHDPPRHAVVVSIDEKSQVQALDRTQPGLPMKRGKCATFTHDYKRNGTTTLFAALSVTEARSSTVACPAIGTRSSSPLSQPSIDPCRRASHPRHPRRLCRPQASRG